MERSWYWRLALIIGLIVGGLYLSLPSFIYLASPSDVRRDKEKLKERIPEGLAKNRLNLGIDLQGGLHLVMGVDANKAVLNRVDRVADEVASEMKDKGKPVSRAARIEQLPAMEIEMGNAADWATLKPILEERGDNWRFDSPSGTKVRYEMIPERVKQLKDDAVAQVIKTLRSRIDELGVTEPEVRKRGDDAVLIQIAGLTADEERSVKDDIIGKTAQLEFKIVDDDSKFFAEIASRAPEGIKLTNDAYQGGPNDGVVSSPYLYSASKEALQAFINQNPPPSDRVVSYSKTQLEGVDQWRTWLLDRKTPLTGDSIVSAAVGFNPDEYRNFVQLKLDNAGGVIFDALTAANIKRRVAIVLDDNVDSAPVIQSRIPSGNVSITLGGSRTSQEILAEANALAVVLNAGALPAPVYPQEERTVGATLGDDAISKGETVVFASVIMVIVIMVGYYKACGALAIFAMAVNLLLQFAVLAGLNASLTLPGLAGLSLTIGMAVDSNVVQFERVRDELRLGKTVRAAIDGGLDKSFSAIFDSNMTTALSALVLMQYGSGPIRGFAVTLLAGVLINSFTAVVVPRLVLEYVSRTKNLQRLSI